MSRIEFTGNTIRLAQLIKPLAEHRRVEPLAVLLRKLRPQGLHIRHVRVPVKLMRQVCTAHLFDRHQNVDPLTLGRPQRKRIQPPRREHES